MGCGGYKIDKYNNSEIKLTPILHGLPIVFELNVTKIDASNINKYDIVNADDVVGHSNELNNFIKLSIYDPAQYFVGLNAKSKFWKNKYDRCKFLNDLNVSSLLSSYGNTAIPANDFLPKGTLGYDSTGAFNKSIQYISDKSTPHVNAISNRFCLSYLTLSIEGKYKNEYLNAFKAIYPNIIMRPIISTKEFGKDFVDSNCDAFLFALKSSYFDGYEYLTIFEDDKVNFSGIYNQHLSAMIKKSQEILNPSIKYKKYQEIIKEIGNFCVIRPLLTIPIKKLYVRKGLKTSGIGSVPTHLYYLGNITR